MVGVDLYIDWPSADPKTLVTVLEKANGGGLTLKIVDSRGVKVWPDGLPETFCADNFRCRFLGEGTITPHQVVALLGRVADLNVDVVQTEYLRNFEGVAGFSLSQGQ